MPRHAPEGAKLSKGIGLAKQAFYQKDRERNRKDALNFLESMEMNGNKRSKQVMGLPWWLACFCVETPKIGPLEYCFAGGIHEIQRGQFIFYGETCAFSTVWLAIISLKAFRSPTWTHLISSLLSLICFGIPAYLHFFFVTLLFLCLVAAPVGWSALCSCCLLLVAAIAAAVAARTEFHQGFHCHQEEGCIGGHPEQQQEAEPTCNSFRGERGRGTV